MLNTLQELHTGMRINPALPYCMVHTRHGDELPVEIERLWSTLALNRRNIIPVLDFLATLGTHVAYQVGHWQLSCSCHWQ